MNKLAVCTLTRELLAAVLVDLWEVSRDEISVWGGDVDPEIFMRTLFHVAVVQEATGEPVCALGGDLEMPGVAWTWFLASGLFPANAHKTTRIVHRLLREQAKAYNLRKIVTTSGSAHTMAHSWFRLLGYSQDGETSWKNGVARRYVMEL